MTPVLAPFVFVAGLILGSFLNVCIYRLPRGLSVVRPGSACPNCGTPVKPYDNVPVLSWLILRGRCRKCKAPITPRYMIVELVCGLLFLATLYVFGPTLAAVKYAVLSFLLLGLIFTDAETQLLPDAMTIPGTVIGLAFSLFVPLNDVVTQLGPAVLDRHLDWRFASFLDSLLGALVGAGFIWAARIGYWLVRRVEGMGLGDVKLMALIGSFIGFKLTLFTILGASIAGALYGLSAVPVVWVKRRRRWLSRGHGSSVARERATQSARLVLRYHAMPFGVFLGSVALLAVFFGHRLLSWYWSQLPVQG